MKFRRQIDETRRQPRPARRHRQTRIRSRCRGQRRGTRNTRGGKLVGTGSSGAFYANPRIPFDTESWKDVLVTSPGSAATGTKVFSTREQRDNELAKNDLLRQELGDTALFLSRYFLLYKAFGESKSRAELIRTAHEWNKRKTDSELPHPRIHIENDIPEDTNTQSSDDSSSSDGSSSDGSTKSKDSSSVFPMIEYPLATASLQDVLARKKPPIITPATAKEWMKHILKAVHIMHSARLVHLDIKPQNVLLMIDNDRPDQQYPVLSDFELMQHWTEPGQGETFFQQFAYVAYPSVSIYLFDKFPEATLYHDLRTSHYRQFVLNSVLNHLAQLIDHYKSLLPTEMKEIALLQRLHTVLRIECHRGTTPNPSDDKRERQQELMKLINDEKEAFDQVWQASTSSSRRHRVNPSKLWSMYLLQRVDLYSMGIVFARMLVATYNLIDLEASSSHWGEAVVLYIQNVMPFVLPPSKPILEAWIASFRTTGIRTHLSSSCLLDGIVQSIPELFEFQHPTEPSTRVSPSSLARRSKTAKSKFKTPSNTVFRWTTKM